MNPTRIFLLPILVLFATLSVAAIQDRQKQVIPTYTIEIRGVEANDFSVSIEGSYTRPDGKMIEIEKYVSRLPTTFYINADCSFILKIAAQEKKFRATLFYEHEEILKWLSTADGNAETGVRFNVLPYKE